MNPKDKNKVIGQGSPMKLIKGHIKGQKKKRTADYASKPPDHGRRMSSRQILDTHRREAHTRPRHY